MRTKLSTLLSAIDVTTRQSAAIAAAQHFVDSELFKTSHHIACYFPLPKEFDTTPIIDAIWQAKKNCYLPIVSPDKKLHFIRYEKNDELVPNRFNIPEPMLHGENFFPAQQLDVVLLPLIGFDLKGHRLGTGGGYYDRTFNFLKTVPSKPLLIGLGYTIQQAGELPHDEWDVPLDGVLTPEKLLVFLD